MKKYAIVLLLFCATLFSKTLLIVDYGSTKDEVETKKKEFIRKNIKLIKQTNPKISVMKIGDRYTLSLEVLSKQNLKTFIDNLSLSYPNLFYIEMGLDTKKKNKKPPTKNINTKTSDISSNYYLDKEWLFIYLLLVILLIFFIKGMVELLNVRKSQKKIKLEQTQIENELKEV